ncbi:Proton/sodium-glutamate symport protein [compost metagenome]
MEGLAFIAGVDRIMDMARTALNVIGNALAALVIAKWEGVYDKQKGDRFIAMQLAPQRAKGLDIGQKDAY